MSDEPRKEYVNVYGRKGGRGSRPYLIVLKLVCVAGFLGGLMTVLALTLTADEPRSSGDWQRRAELIGRAYLWVIVPGVTGAEVLGVLLLASFWRAAIRMRWFVVKAALVVVCMPTLHFFMSGWVSDLRIFAAAGSDLPRDAAIHKELLGGTAFALVLGVVLLILGRIKPRLGQGYGQTAGANKS